MATATEISAVRIFYTVLAGIFIYRKFEWKRIYPMLLDTASLWHRLIIVGCATAMAWALTQSGFRLVKIMTAVVPARRMGLHRRFGPCLRNPWERTRRNPGDRVRPAAVFDCEWSVLHEVHYAMVVIFAMGLGLFRRPLASAFTPRVQSVVCRRTSRSAASGRTSRRCSWRW